MKKICCLMLILFSLILYNCGGGSGGSSSSTNENNIKIPEVVKSTSSATAKDISNLFQNDPNLKDKKIIIDEETNASQQPLEILEKDYVYTYSKNGLVVKVPIPEGSKHPIKVSELKNLEVDNVSAVYEEIQKTEKNYPYTLSGYNTGFIPVDKAVKLPFCNDKKTICIIIDNLKNFKKDLTISVVPYGDLTVVPNNSIDILKKYYVPVSEYSADIGVEDTQKRFSISEIENIFKGDNTTLTIYLSLPYKDNLKEVFNPNEDYKIFLLKSDAFGNNYLEEQPGNVKVVQWNKDNVTLKALYENSKGIYPFVIARKMKVSQIREVKGKVENEGLKNIPIIIRACPENVDPNNLEEVGRCEKISFGLIDSNGNYDFVYEKPKDKKVYAVITSVYYKPIAIEVNDNNSLDFTNLERNPKYPAPSSLSAGDKKVLFSMIRSYNYWNEPKDYFYPDDIDFLLELDSGDNKTVLEENNKLKNYIKMFLKNEIDKDYNKSNSFVLSNSLRNINISYELNIEKDKFLKLKGNNKVNNGNNDYKNNYTLTINKKSENEFTITYEDGYYEDEYFEINGQKRDSYNYNGSSKSTWTLFVKDNFRAVKDVNCDFEESESYIKCQGEGNNAECSNIKGIADVKGVDTIIKKGNRYVLIRKFNKTKRGLDIKNNSCEFKVSYEVTKVAPIDENYNYYNNYTMTISNIETNFKSKLNSSTFNVFYTNTSQNNGYANGEFLINLEKYSQEEVYKYNFYQTITDYCHYIAAKTVTEK